MLVWGLVGGSQVPNMRPAAFEIVFRAKLLSEPMSENQMRASVMMNVAPLGVQLSDWVLRATQALLGMGLQGKVVGEDNVRVASFKSCALLSSIRPRRVELR